MLRLANEMFPVKHLKSSFKPQLFFYFKVSSFHFILGVSIFGEIFHNLE